MEIKILDKEEFSDLIPSYVELNNKIFNQKVNEDYFQWRYLNNPNEDLLVCVAIDQGKVVANYAATGFLLINNNENQLKSAQSLNTMTDPDYQGQGLFMKTASTLYDEMKKRNYDLTWGFPNNLSHWIFKNKLLWKDVYEFPTLSLRVTDRNPVENKKLNTVNYSNVYKLLFSKYFMENHYQIDKNNQYLKWRYLDNPINKYHFFYHNIQTNNGTYDYIVLKEYDNKLNIVELEAEDKNVLKLLIDFSINFAINKGLEYVTIWSSINSNVYSFVESYGFWLDLPIFHLSTRFFNESKEDSFNWNVSQGDDNIF